MNFDIKLSVIILAKNETKIKKKHKNIPAVAELAGHGGSKDGVAPQMLGLAGRQFED